jgi:multidrug efflux pump subunit AcrB
VSDTATYRELNDRARDLERRLEGAPGVGDVVVRGAPVQEVAVTLDLRRMIALGVSPLEVASAIGLEAANVPAGSVDAGARQLAVKTSGDYASIDEVAETPVRTGPTGDVLRVGDVAEVALSDAEARSFARHDGKRAVLVAAPQKEDQNVFAVRDAIVRELDAFEAELSPGVSLVRGFDQSKNVAHRLQGFVRDFGLAILLVLVTLLPLGLRASFVVMISIPLSLAITRSSARARSASCPSCSRP